MTIQDSPATVTFLATIPLLQSAIQVSGDGGLRLKLDVPESEMNAAVGLLGMRGEVLSVTVEVLKNNAISTGSEWEPKRETKEDASAHDDSRARGRQDRQRPKWSIGDGATLPSTAPVGTGDNGKSNAG